MEIKYVVFVVAAVLAQAFARSSPALSITADSTANSTANSTASSTANTTITNSTVDRSQIMLLNEESSIQNAVASLEVIFERITKLTVEQIFNDTPSSKYNAAAATEPALLRIKDAVYYPLNNTLTIASKTSCDAVEGARRKSSLVLERIWANITNAIAFVGSSDSTSDSTSNSTSDSTNPEENTTGLAKTVSRKINKYQTRVRHDFELIVQNIVRTAATCAEITSIDQLQVVRIYHDRMDLALHRFTNSVFNAIRYYAYARASESPGLRIMQGIEQEKTKANAAWVHNVESAFAMMEAIYINTGLNKTEDVFPEVAEIVYTRKYAGYRFKAAADALFSRVDGYLFESKLDFAQAGDEDFTLDDSVHASVIHLWKSGTQQFLSSFDSENPDAVSQFPEELSTIISAIAENFATQLHLAKTAPEDSDTVPQIDDLNAKAAVWAVKYVNLIYKALLNEKTITTSIQTIKRTTVTQMKIFMDSMSKSFKIVAEVVSKTRNVADVNDSLTEFKSQVYSAVNEIAQSISDARVSIVSSDS